MEVMDVKMLLGLKTDKHDQYIEAMIPILMEYAKDYCNTSFFIAEEEIIPGPVKLFIAKAIEFNMNPAGVSARSMGGASYSYETDFPSSITRLLKPYRKVRFA